MATREGLEALIIVFSLGVFLGYHMWLILLRGRGYDAHNGDRFHDFFTAGKAARSVWAEACTAEEKEAIVAVQTLRNALMGCTYMATVSAVLATAGITIMLDPSKTDRIAAIAVGMEAAGVC